jgi:hypothetical protein
MSYCEKSSIVFLLLNHIRTMSLSESVDKFRNQERIQSLAYELFSRRIQINSGEKNPLKGPATLLSL